MFWETIWLASENSELRLERESGNILQPGDEVFVPEKTLKDESGATEQCHTFTRRGVPATLRIKLLKDVEQEDEPEDPAEPAAEATDDNYVGEAPSLDLEPVPQEPDANAPYRLTVDNVTTESTTDDEGMIEIAVPEGARRARIIVRPGTEDEEIIDIDLGTMDPISTVTGVKKRLAPLEFYEGDTENDADDDLVDALRLFQATHGLEQTGEIDQSTRDKLVEVHGS